MEYASKLHGFPWHIAIHTLWRRYRIGFSDTVPIKWHFKVLNEYQGIVPALILKTLADRRLSCNLVTTFKLLNGFIICPEKLKKIKLKIPVRAVCEQRVFVERFHFANYSKHSPLDRSLGLINGSNIVIFLRIFTSFKSDRIG